MFFKACPTIIVVVVVCIVVLVVVVALLLLLLTFVIHVICYLSLQNEGYCNNILPDWSSFCQPSKYGLRKILENTLKNLKTGCSYTTMQFYVHLLSNLKRVHAHYIVQWEVSDLESFTTVHWHPFLPFSLYSYCYKYHLCPTIYLLLIWSLTLCVSLVTDFI